MHLYMCELVSKFNECKTTYGFLAYWLDQRQDKRHLTHGGQPLAILSSCSMVNGDRPKTDGVLTIMLTLISLVLMACCALDTHHTLSLPLNLCVATMNVFLLKETQAQRCSFGKPKKRVSGRRPCSERCDTRYRPHRIQLWRS